MSSDRLTVVKFTTSEKGNRVFFSFSKVEFKGFFFFKVNSNHCFFFLDVKLIAKLTRAEKGIRTGFFSKVQFKRFFFFQP